MVGLLRGLRLGMERQTVTCPRRVESSDPDRRIHGVLGHLPLRLQQCLP